jgi:multidrug efflux pump subunit AcrA (membrane-fusion protein)
MPATNRSKWWFLGGAVVVLAGAVVGPGLHGGADAKTDIPSRSIAEVAVTTAPATSRGIERRVAVVGTLEGHEEVNLSAKVEGRVLRIHHDIGDVVAPGEPLAELDPTDWRLGVLEAQRGLELELARLGMKELTDKLDLDRVPPVLRARNLEENARAVQDRARRLGGKVISAEEMEKAQTEYRVARANREQAELEAQATLASARLKQAQLDTARQKLSDTRLCVPAPSAARLPPGLALKDLRYVVAARKAAEGEMVRAVPSATLFRLVIEHPLKLVAQVPERFIAEVRHGQRVTLAVEAYPGDTFAGVVSRLNPTVERASRSFTVEVSVPNETRRLKAGSFVKASVLTRHADHALTVPEESVVRFAGVVKVFVVEAGKARSVTVRTGEVITLGEGERARRWIEVIGPLSAGAAVVTSGQQQLADGTPVSVRK